jgi:hypothetical protein
MLVQRVMGPGQWRRQWRVSSQRASVRCKGLRSGTRCLARWHRARARQGGFGKGKGVGGGGAQAREVSDLALPGRQMWDVVVLLAGAKLSVCRRHMCRISDGSREGMYRRVEPLNGGGMLATAIPAVFDWVSRMAVACAIPGMVVFFVLSTAGLSLVYCLSRSCSSATF